MESRTKEREAFVKQVAVWSDAQQRLWEAWNPVVEAAKAAYVDGDDGLPLSLSVGYLDSMAERDFEQAMSICQVGFHLSAFGVEGASGADRPQWQDRMNTLESMLEWGSESTVTDTEVIERSFDTL